MNSTDFSIIFFLLFKNRHFMLKYVVLIMLMMFSQFFFCSNFTWHFSRFFVVRKFLTTEKSIQWTVKYIVWKARFLISYLE
jgi:hypothetical protein